jgi:hypothetical protein
MSLDVLFSYLIDSSWFFLGSWVAVLLVAYIAAFRRDSV